MTASTPSSITPQVATITDDPTKILEFVVREAEAGGAALATLVEIDRRRSRLRMTGARMAASGRRYFPANAPA